MKSTLTHTAEQKKAWSERMRIAKEKKAELRIERNERILPDTATPTTADKQENKEKTETAGQTKQIAETGQKCHRCGHSYPSNEATTREQKKCCPECLSPQGWAR